MPEVIYLLKIKLFLAFSIFWFLLLCLVHTRGFSILTDFKNMGDHRHDKFNRVLIFCTPDDSLKMQDHTLGVYSKWFQSGFGNSQKLVWSNVTPEKHKHRGRPLSLADRACVCFGLHRKTKKEKKNWMKSWLRRCFCIFQQELGWVSALHKAISDCWCFQIMLLSLTIADFCSIFHRCSFHTTRLQVHVWCLGFEIRVRLQPRW